MGIDRITELICGMVTDNDDPEGLGRLKLKVQYRGEEVDTDWIAMAIPFDVECIIPYVGDIVVIEYEDGDLCKGSVICGPGGPVNAEQKEAYKAYKNSISIVKKENGYRIMMRGTEEEEKVQIFSPDGERYDIMTKEGRDVEIKTYGEMKRKVKLSAKSKVTIVGDSGEIEITGENPEDRVSVEIDLSSNDEDADAGDEEDRGDKDIKLN